MSPKVKPRKAATKSSTTTKRRSTTTKSGASSRTRRTSSSSGSGGSSNGSVNIRMYNVGFGDCFLLTFPGPITMLIDCGSTKAADNITIKDIVDDIHDYLSTTTNGRLDVLVATHAHKDHVSGFANAKWSELDIGEVWLPWTESDEPLAKQIRKHQTALTEALDGIIARRLTTAASAKDKINLENLRSIVQNSLRSLPANKSALDALNSGFGDADRVKYMPDKYMQKVKVKKLSALDVTVLGPPRVANILIESRLPSEQREYLNWLNKQLALNGIDLNQLGENQATTSDDSYLAPGITNIGNYANPQGAKLAAMLEPPKDAPFKARFMYTESEFARHYKDLVIQSNRKALLNEMSDELLEVLATSTSGHVNNTSLVLFFKIGKLRMLFPGDAEWLTWKTLTEDDSVKTMLGETDFYKVGHHGSSNANPRDLINELPNSMHCMASTLSGKHDTGTGPNPNPDPRVFAALAKHKASVVRSDDKPKAKLPTGFQRVNALCVEAILTI